MILLPSSVRVYVATAAVSLRKSFEGLSNEVRAVIGRDPLSGHVFLFLNRRKTQASGARPFCFREGAVARRSRGGSRRRRAGDAARRHRREFGAKEPALATGGVRDRRGRATCGVRKTRQCTIFVALTLALARQAFSVASCK